MKGYSGATLQEVVSHAMEHITLSDDDGNNMSNSNSMCPSNTWILCAGENDIGRGCSLDETLESLNGLFRWKNREQPTLRVVLLGPKLEPWLTVEPASRKKIRQDEQSYGKSVPKPRSSLCGLLNRVLRTRVCRTAREPCGEDERILF